MFQATSTQNLTVKGVDVTVHGLRHWECPECSAQVETPDQIDFNAVLVREAFLRERAAHKRQRGLLTGTEILAFRNRFGVTQKLAAQLFGGGPTAFAKYEAEEVVHHIDHNRSNNELNNLQLMTRSEHTRLHRLEQTKRKNHG